MSARPEPPRGRLAGTDGFTLLEVMVAFTVMATILTVVYRGVVTMRQGVVAFDDHTDRALVARALLDGALADRKLKSGTYHGVREGRRWTIVARTVDLRGELPPPADTGPKAADAQSGLGQAAPSGQPGAAGPPALGEQPAPDAKAGEKKIAWATQRLLVRLESKGKPFEIETLRLVRAEK